VVGGFIDLERSGHLDCGERIAHDELLVGALVSSSMAMAK